MKRTRAIALGAATLAVALSTGTLVQQLAPPDHPALARGDGAAEPPVEGATLPEIRDETITPLAADLEALDAEAVLAEADAAPALSGEAVRELTRGTMLAVDTDLWRMSEILPRLAELAEAAAEAALEAGAPLADATAPMDCTPRLVLEAVAPAMLHVAFDAPCHPDARATVRHAGLAITGRTSALGALDLTLPALAEAAEVTVALSGGPSASAETEVPDLGGYDRVAVQWQNADAFQLHAHEFGARFGEPGHISAANPAGPERALGGVGGFLTLLGDSGTDWPLLAEVYSFPAERIGRSGAVVLTLEAAVTAETCGRELLGETLEMRRGGPVTRTDVHVAMPDCDAIGDFVLLGNLLDDLVLARN